MNTNSQNLEPENKYLDDNTEPVIDPEGSHTETLIFLHGLGDKAYKLSKFFKLVKEERPYLTSTRVVFVNAPQREVTCNCNMVMSSWFDILELRDKMDVNLKEKGLKELTETTERLNNIIEEEIRIIKDSKRVFIGGLSQGCATSIYVGTSFSKPLGGIMGFIGWVLPVTKFSDSNKDIPIFLGHGRVDPLVPFSIADKTYDTLKSGQITRMVDDDADHWISAKMAEAAKKWLTELTCSAQQPNKSKEEATDVTNEINH